MELSEVGFLENTYSKALVLTFTALTYQARGEPKQALHSLTIL